MNLTVRTPGSIARPARYRIALIASALVACGCGPRPAPVAAAPAPGRDAAPEAIVPRVDHHLHLLSPSVAEVLRGPLLPAVAVPPDVEGLLQSRARAWNDPGALRRLYARDAIIVIDQWGQKSGIFRGADVATRYLSGRFGRPYQLTPTAFTATERTARVIGYYSRGEGAGTRHVGYFHLGLARGADGGWVIETEVPTFPREAPLASTQAEQLIEMLDAAGIQRAVVPSGAVAFGGYWVDAYRDQQTPADRYPRVRAENDWNAAQAGRFPDRLVSFCSFNILEPYAMEELARCPGAGHRGLKLHFDEDQMDFMNPDHLEKARRVFALANRLKFPILAHIANNEGTLADTEARMRNFFETVVAAAPDVTVQIAHLWGGGGYSEAGLVALANVVSSGHPAARNVYFDLADITRVIEQEGERARERWQTVAAQIRRIGLDRILFGSDGGLPGYHEPAEAWRQFRENAPLTDDEFRTIARNVAPYLR